MHCWTYLKCCGNFGKNLVGPQVSLHRWSNSYIHDTYVHKYIYIISSSSQKEEAVKY